jgi:hypothetical protein
VFISSLVSASASIPASALSRLPPADDGYDDDEDGNNSFIGF